MERGDNGYQITDFSTTSLDNKNSSTKSHGQIIDEIGKVFVNFVPDDDCQIFFVREKAFNARAAQSEMAIYKVVGFMDWILYRVQNGKWNEIYPVSVKKYVTGSGKSDKNEVAKMLPYYFGIREYQNDDESDAAAVAAAFLIENNVLRTAISESKGGEDDVSAPSEIHQSV